MTNTNTNATPKPVFEESPHYNSGVYNISRKGDVYTYRYTLARNTNSVVETHAISEMPSVGDGMVKLSLTDYDAEVNARNYNQNAYRSFVREYKSPSKADAHKSLMRALSHNRDFDYYYDGKRIVITQYSDQVDWHYDDLDAPATANVMFCHDMLPSGEWVMMDVKTEIIVREHDHALPHFDYSNYVLYWQESEVGSNSAWVTYAPTQWRKQLLTRVQWDMDFDNAKSAHIYITVMQATVDYTKLLKEHIEANNGQVMWRSK